MPARPTINDPAPIAAKLAPLEEEGAADEDPDAPAMVPELIIIESLMVAELIIIESLPVIDIIELPVIAIIESLPVISIPDMLIPDMSRPSPSDMAMPWAMAIGIIVKTEREKRIVMMKN